MNIRVFIWALLGRESAAMDHYSKWRFITANSDAPNDAQILAWWEKNYPDIWREMLMTCIAVEE